MTIAAPTSASALPSSSYATTEAPPDAATQLAPLIQQLQQLAQQLGAITASLAGAGGAQLGAGTLAGGPTADDPTAPSSGCSCGGMQSVQGAQAVEQSPVQQVPVPATDADGAADPTPAQGTTSEQEDEPKQQSSTTRAAETPDTKFDLKRKNPRSTAEAIAWARKQIKDPSRDYYRFCLGFVALAYGWNASGVPRAIDAWKQAPAATKHKGDTEPPVGALVYWDTGAGRAGHVAIYTGNGKVISNDIRRNGKLDEVPMSEISKKWGAKYLGWTDPYFPNGV